MHCPRDHSPLSLRSVEGHSGYRCSQCLGAWLPLKYIKSIEFSRHFSYPAFVASLTEGRRQNAPLSCPVGCGELNEVLFSNISLHSCPACQGMWFNYGAVSELLSRHQSRNEVGVGAAIAAESGAWGIVGLLSALFS
jgi:Zn-finger nucleic acid-binding protein